MKKAAWILAILFGIVFLGTTLLNADLIARSRRALASGVLRDDSGLEPLRNHLMVLVPDRDDSFFAGLLEGIAAAAPAAEAAVQVFRYPEAQAADAERYFEIALKAKADGLIMYAPRSERVGERIEAAAREGVVLVPVGTDAPLDASPRFIGSGSLLQGLEGGRLIGAALGSAARIGVILPAGGSGAVEEDPLYRGVAAAIESYRGASILAAARARPGLLSGEEAAASMLRSQPRINALFCSSSRDTVGAAQVVVDSNRVGSVLIVGADETPEIRRYIDKGVVAASIVRDSRRIGEEAVRAFSLVKAGLPPPAAREPSFFVRTIAGVSP